MACNPKYLRGRRKLIAILNRHGKKLGYIMHPPVWIDGIPHVAFSKREED